MTAQAWILIAAIVAVLLVAFVSGFVLYRRRRVTLTPKAPEKEVTDRSGGYTASGGFSFSQGGTATATPPRPEPVPIERTDDEGQPHIGDDAAIPRDSVRRTITDVRLPEPETVEQTTEFAAPTTSTPSAETAEGAASPDSAQDAATTTPAAPTASAEAAPTAPTEAPPSDSAEVAPTAPTEVPPSDSAEVAPTGTAGVTSPGTADAAPTARTEAASTARAETASSAPTKAESSAPAQAAPSAPTKVPPSAPAQAASSAPTKAAPSAPAQAESSAPAQAPSSAPTKAPSSAQAQAASSTSTEVAPSAPAQVEEIEPTSGRLTRLRGRLARSQNAVGKSLLGLLGGGDLDEDSWEEIEDTLVMADLGTASTTAIVQRLREELASRTVRTADQARQVLRDVLIEALRPELNRSVRALPHDDHPSILLVVGVNGTGKTTTTGKLARVLVADGRRVLLGAADTFRAAAADQLQTWGERVGADTVRGREGADPASVAFDAVSTGIDNGVDVVLIDTAGRLHTKTGLMDELGKVKRVVEKKAAVDEVLLVLDATVGQNGLTQARVFAEVVDITGVVLTKLDGTAKGGIVFQVQHELGVPVKLVGLGEGADDLAPFEPGAFVDALLG
ncbi:signal recognition particle-docking protein FtsY [Nocardia terpenica]|uniref:Signal recognition particle receptor FtsY n=1 Tax=Nocardia terpenica TaxID=455432 RepID=A0A291RQ57_9NOCA|nr:signal recognition particle-docking protein FtsY [Nocardia terpenica]ATL69455.1 signal recognition particle-docking protein FtsY [Nocardia terpenica]